MRAAAFLQICGLLALTTLLAAPARAQRDLVASGGLEKCLIPPEALNEYTGWPALRAACNADEAPLDKRCTGCACALVASLEDTLRSQGYKLDLKNLTTADATTALSLCADVLLPAVEAGGIDIASIVELQSCSAAPPCLSGLLAGS